MYTQELANITLWFEDKTTVYIRVWTINKVICDNEMNKKTIQKHLIQTYSQVQFVQEKFSTNFKFYWHKRL